MSCLYQQLLATSDRYPRTGLLELLRLYSIVELLTHWGIGKKDRDKGQVFYGLGTSFFETGYEYCVLKVNPRHTNDLGDFYQLS